MAQDKNRNLPAGEDGLVRSFRRMVDAAGIRPPGLALGIGDDAAVIRAGKDDLVVSNDVLVEDRHFVRAWYAAPALGWRAAAVNLSDIAAMGAAPRYALVSLLIPDATSPAFVRGIERGLVDHFARYGAAVIGGNVSSTGGPLVIDVTVVGACARGRAWRRKARPGDAIVVAGTLGDAAMGLDMLRGDGQARGRLVEALRRPVPRLDVSRLLVRESAVHGAIDVSDGFSTDLIRMCAAAGTGCHVEAGALPVSAALRERCRRNGDEPLRWVMGGGDDYALVLSVAPSKAGKIAATIRDTLGVPADVVGKFTPSAGRHTIAREDGRTVPFRPTGWDHFAPRGPAE